MKKPVNYHFATKPKTPCSKPESHSPGNKHFGDKSCQPIPNKFSLKSPSTNKRRRLFNISIHCRSNLEQIVLQQRECYISKGAALLRAGCSLHLVGKGWELTTHHLSALLYTQFATSCSQYAKRL